MKFSLLLPTIVLLASCADPTSPSAPEPPVEPTAPPEETKPKVEPKPEAPEPPERGEVTSIGIDQIFPLRMEDKALMVDVRPVLLYKLGHIDGAISMPVADFKNSFPKVKPQLDAAVAAGKVIITYCQSESCPDASSAGRYLAAQGYDVSVYRAGLSEWKAVGVE